MYDYPGTFLKNPSPIFIFAPGKYWSCWSLIRILEFPVQDGNIELSLASNSQHSAPIGGDSPHSVSHWLTASPGLRALISPGSNSPSWAAELYLTPVAPLRHSVFRPRNRFCFATFTFVLVASSSSDWSRMSLLGLSLVSVTRWWSPTGCAWLWCGHDIMIMTHLQNLYRQSRRYYKGVKITLWNKAVSKLWVTSPHILCSQQHHRILPYSCFHITELHKFCLYIYLIP